MAATYAPILAFNYCLQLIKSMPLQTIQLQILQDAADTLWMAAPWRWTIGTIGPIALVNNQSFVAETFPADFLRLEKATITGNVTSSPLLVVVANVPTPTLTQMPRTVAADVTNNKLTFETNFVQAANEAYKLRALYKKTDTKFDSATIQTGNLGMDDEWFWVYNEMVLYYAYKYADDQRAGQVQVQMALDGVGASKVQYNYTGQLGVAHAAIEQMRLSEPMILVPPDPMPSPEKEH